MSKLHAIKSETMADAVKERDRFLEDHPELQALQREIDQRLNGAETDHNRLVLVSQLMMESFLKLDEKLQSLREARKRRNSGQNGSVHQCSLECAGNQRRPMFLILKRIQRGAVPRDVGCMPLTSQSYIPLTRGRYGYSGRHGVPFAATIRLTIYFSR
jgi:hypothetical protein